MDPLQALNVAMVNADAAGDTDAVNRLYAMRNNPAGLGRLLLALSSDDGQDDATKFADATGEYACVMLPLVGDAADALLELGQRVAYRDLADKGLEWEPHVTALYGLQDGTLPMVETVAKAFGPVPLALGRVSVFPARPDKPYDVLYAKVISPDLTRLNEALKQLPHTDVNPGPFAAHATIGYLKPGRGVAYATRFGNVGKTVTVPCLVYSDAMKRQSAVPLGATASFADWKPGTSPATGEHGWISSGGQFRKEKPAGGGDDDSEHAKRTGALADAVAESLSSDPELKGNQQKLAKVKELAITAGAHVLLAVQRIQDHWAGKAIGGIMDAYFDNPTDMGKLGYNPGNTAQTASPKTLDSVSSNLNDALGFGLSGHLVAKIAAEVLSRGFLFLRNKARGPQQMADDGAPNAEELGQILADLFNEVNKSLGLDGVNDPKAIADAVRPLLVHVNGAAEQFGDWKPGQSPKTGEQGWVSAGGAFRKNRPTASDSAADAPTGADQLDPYAVAKGVLDKATDPVARDFIESALFNANPDDPKDLARELSSMWSHAVIGKHAEAAAEIAKILPAAGAAFDGPEPGQPVAHSGAKYTAPVGVFPGDAVQVVRQPIVHEDGTVLVKGQVGTVGAKMADDEPTNADLKPVTQAGGKPASGDVSLAGADGKQLAHVIREAKDFGVKRVAAVMQQAAARYGGSGPFLNEHETGQVADAIAAVNATAELLGRSRVRDLQQRAGASDAGGDQPFRKFADNPLKAIQTPQEALDYFTSLYPSIGVDPERFAGEQRRRAFTLAASMDETVTKSIQDRLTEALKQHEGTADAAQALQQALELAGVTHANPQYSEMVFRTNAMDAYQTGAYEEGAHDDVADVFPCWQYLGIKDGRQGKDHEPHFDRYYPRTAKFADVRGDRPFNCRCSLRWVDQFEWSDLQDRGVKMEGGK